MNEKPKVPDLLLEKLVMGELLPDQEADVLRRLEGEPGGMERLDRIKVSNEEILADYPPGQTAVEIERRYSNIKHTEPGKGIWKAFPVLATATAVLLLMVLSVQRIWQSDNAGIEVRGKGEMEYATRIKGGQRLIVHRKGKTGVEELNNGDEVKSGDIIQLSYVAAGAGYGMIFSVDGLGNLTLHYPDTPLQSTSLESGGARKLSFAYELDDAPGFERFFLITADEAIDVNAVLHTVGSLEINAESELILPGNPGRIDFILKKEEVIQ
jgi:hypothetical protein